MFTTMARQGGRVQLEQSDMLLALDMAKMAKGGYLRAAIQETHELIKKPHAEVREEKKRGVEIPGHQKVKAAIERYPAIVYKNHTDGCFTWQNATGKHRWTRWRHKGTGAPPPEPATPPPGTQPLPGMPVALPGEPDENESYEIDGMPFRCVYIHSPYPTLNFSIIMHMPRIASAMKMLFQIC